MRAYLRQRRSVLAAFACFLAIFAVSLLLYRVPLRVVAYPCVLCVLAGALWLSADALRVRRRHDRLKRGVPEELPEPRSIEERDYQTMIRALCEQRNADAAQAERRYNDMTDYYTMWAHQIKTPIAGMRIALQNEDTALSRRLRSELSRIEGYVGMVLTYLRLESDSTDYVFRDVRLDEVIRRTVRGLAPDFIARKLTLRFIETNETVLTDEKWLAFVLEQVLSNALKYTREGGIEIYAEPGPVLCVRDTGIGIAPEELPRIFEHGFTGMTGRADRRATGIGLYLCRRICTCLGHTIEAESEPGTGTVIHIGLQGGCAV